MTDDARHKPNIENAKLFRNKVVFSIVAFFVVCAYYGTDYKNDIEAATKHVEGSVALEKYYNSVITEQKVINATMNGKLTSLKDTMERIKGELIRLKLVSVEDTQPKNPNGT